MPHSILLLCPDVITERMAGPAIRYWEFAKALVTEHTVTLAAPNPISSSVYLEKIQLIQHHVDNIAELIEQHDIIIFQGYILENYPLLRRCRKILIADLYDPIPLEGLEQKPDSTHPVTEQIRVINDQLKYADYFLCANDRQRDLWLGHLLSLGRVNITTYAEMQQRVITIPFGLPDTMPQLETHGFRSQSALENAFILLWGGGIWEWFDPLTLIRAVHRLLPRYPQLKLIFLGTQHPNPTIPAMLMQQRAEHLARELEIAGTAVIFQAGWVNYDQLANYLLDANVGVTAHFESLETHFSFRTRVLHYLWAGKPIIATKGDVLADAIIQASAGIVVDYQDEIGWITAIEQLQNPQQYAIYQAGVRQLAQKYTWSTVTAPLRNLCHQARLAPDMYIENGCRYSQVWNCEQAYHQLRHEIYVMEHSHSWKITAPLRNCRRWLSRLKNK